MIRIGIVGTGFGLYGLLPAFDGLPGCGVAALCGARKAHLKERWKAVSPSVRRYDDWEEMLEHEQLDAIALAVVPAAQYKIASNALKRGLHVFAEKPLCVTTAQAMTLLKLAREKKLVHGLDFPFPEIAAWKTVKQMLEKKEFGTLKHVSVAWDFLSYGIRHGETSWKTDASQGGGALSFYFSHGLHYLEHFAGPIGAMKSIFTYDKESKKGAEVAVDILLSFKQKGCTGFAHVCCNRRGLARHRLEFQCQHGVILLENRDAVMDDFSITTFADGKMRTVPVTPDRDRGNEDPRVKIVRRLAGRFVESCATGARMSPSFEDGLRVQQLIDMAHKGKMRA